MKILLATDGSPYSQTAGKLLARLAWPPTRELTVLSVVDRLELLTATMETGQDDEQDAGEQLQQGD